MNTLIYSSETICIPEHRLGMNNAKTQPQLSARVKHELDETEISEA